MTSPRLDLTTLLQSGDLWLGNRHPSAKNTAATITKIQTLLNETPLNEQQDPPAASSISPYSFNLPPHPSTEPIPSLRPATIHELALTSACTTTSKTLWTPPLFAICQILKTTADHQRQHLSLQANSLLAAWVGRKSWPTVQLLDSFLTPADWRSRCLFIAPPDREARLWAATQVLRSGCFSSVIVDGTRFDFAATRRLQLAAKEGNTIALMVRPPWEIEERSAAVTRWLFTPVPSEENRPRWKLILKRARGMAGEQSWVVELGPSTGSGQGKGELTFCESAVEEISTEQRRHAR